VLNTTNRPEERDSLLYFWREEIVKTAREYGHRCPRRRIHLRKRLGYILGLVRCDSCRTAGVLDTSSYPHPYFGPLFAVHCYKASIVLPKLDGWLTLRQREYIEALALLDKLRSDRNGTPSPFLISS